MGISLFGYLKWNAVLQKCFCRISSKPASLFPGISRLGYRTCVYSPIENHSYKIEASFSICAWTLAVTRELLMLPALRSWHVSEPSTSPVLPLYREKHPSWLALFHGLTTSLWSVLVIYLLVRHQNISRQQMRLNGPLQYNWPVAMHQNAEKQILGWCQWARFQWLEKQTFVTDSRRDLAQWMGNEGQGLALLGIGSFGLREAKVERANSKAGSFSDISPPCTMNEWWAGWPQECSAFSVPESDLASLEKSSPQILRLCCQDWKKRHTRAGAAGAPT